MAGVHVGESVKIATVHPIEPRLLTQINTTHLLYFVVIGPLARACGRRRDLVVGLEVALVLERLLDGHILLRCIALTVALVLQFAQVLCVRSTAALHATTSLVPWVALLSLSGHLDQIEGAMVVVLLVPFIHARVIAI